MVRRDVDALVRWAAGSGIAAALPHAINLPSALAGLMTWLGGIGILLAAIIAIVVGLRKLVIEATRLLDALDKLQRQFRRLRRRSEGSSTRKGGTHKAPPSPGR